MALAWLLHQDGVTAPIIGPRTHASRRRAAGAGDSLDADVLARLDEIFPGFKPAPSTTPGERAGPAALPLLRDRSGNQRVTNIELFFDLVYVFAVTQLSHYLLRHGRSRARSRPRSCWRWCGWPGPTRRG